MVPGRNCAAASSDRRASCPSPDVNLTGKQDCTIGPAIPGRRPVCLCPVAFPLTVYISCKNPSALPPSLGQSGYASLRQRTLSLVPLVIPSVVVAAGLLTCPVPPPAATSAPPAHRSFRSTASPEGWLPPTPAEVEAFVKAVNGVSIPLVSNGSSGGCGGFSQTSEPLPPDGVDFFLNGFLQVALRTSWTRRKRALRQPRQQHGPHRNPPPWRRRPPRRRPASLHSSCGPPPSRCCSSCSAPVGR